MQSLAKTVHDKHGTIPHLLQYPFFILIRCGRGHKHDFYEIFFSQIISSPYSTEPERCASPTYALILLMYLSVDLVADVAFKCGVESFLFDKFCMQSSQLCTQTPLPSAFASGQAPLFIGVFTKRMSSDLSACCLHTMHFRVFSGWTYHSPCVSCSSILSVEYGLTSIFQPVSFAARRAF